MTTHKTAPRVPKVTKKSISGYFASIKKEAKKVHWTSKPELLRSTKLVVLATPIFGFLIYGADLAVKGFLDLLGMLFGVVG